MRLLLGSMLCVLVTGCRSKPDKDAELEEVTEPGDRDQDGVITEQDCDDDDPTVGAVANDQDCDRATTADDCDDDDPTVGAVANDQDCDRATTADDCDDNDATLNLADVDGDGVTTCDDDPDCDDENPNAYPGVATNDGAICTIDADGDGFGDATLTSPYDAGSDCDDGNPDAYPGAIELWATEDLDCNGIVSGILSYSDYSFVGENGEDYAGIGVSSAGDVDGDGLDDILVGALLNDDGGSNAGKAYLILGSSLGSSSTIDLSAADYTFVGENSEDYAGSIVSSAGDVDGDGLDDILVGAYLNDDGGSDAGKSYLILGSSLGSSSTIDLSAADYSFVGENSEDDAGIGVSSAGDVDGDGLDDILVGAYQNDDGGSDAGKAYLILGSSLGSSSTIDLSAADYSFVGENSEDYAGWSVSSAGDVDGDGLDDILVGAYYNDDGGSNAGKSYLILGSSLGSNSTIGLSTADYSFVGENSGDRAGRSASGAGDVDGDGLDDILIGAYYNDDGGSNAGKSYLILGSSLGSSASIDLSAADYSFVGENSDDRAGRSVSSAGDVNGDGLDDIIVGASGNDDGGSDAGKSYLILGSSLGSSASIDLSAADYSFVGENSDDGAGSIVSSAGDVNGDGLDDIIVGARHNDDGGSDAGKSYLILSHL